VQDVVVLEAYRHKGIARRIVRELIDRCQRAGIVWVGVIAAPGTETLYAGLGFLPMKGHVPMLLGTARPDA